MVFTNHIIVGRIALHIFCINSGDLRNDEFIDEDNISDQVL